MSRKAPNPPPPKQRKPPAQQILISIEDIFNDVANTGNYAVKILAEIREALGVGHKPMLSDLPELARRIRLGYERYEKLRKLNPMQFTTLHKRAIKENIKFDELVDDLKFN